MRDRLTVIVALAAAAGQALLGLAGSSPAHAQSPGQVTRVSVDSLGAEANGNSDSPAVSADGRFTAFVSEANDLVPGDANDDSDVFVHDRETGVVQRVSIAWNGMEARDDSRSPSISADGRFVAFASRAWNMYDGGANLGNPRWDVYVHDRQEGTTTRLSVSHEGGDPNGDSHAPAISADGSRIAFSSEASNLVPDDGTNFGDVFVVDRASRAITRASVDFEGGDPDHTSFGPALSADGRLVFFASFATDLLSFLAVPPPEYGGNPLVERIFLRDLETGTTEFVSVAVDHPVIAPNSHSEDAAVSGDGRYVAFTSRATNLVFPFPNDFTFGGNVYVRDRWAGTTVLASRHDPDVTDCGRDGVSFFCKPGTSHSPSISQDGRFVAYTSSSMRLLPENLYGGTQIYVFDRESERLRRLSVDETGREGNSCSEQPALSGDGEVLVYRSASTNLVADDANGAADVFRHDWTCSASGNCRALAACPAEPMRCARAERGVLRIYKRPVGQLGGDRLFWRWAASEAASGGDPFPSPMEGSSYQVCVYAGEVKQLAADVSVPLAGVCGEDGATPCWEADDKGYRLAGGTEGLTKLTLQKGQETRRIIARGRGAMLDLPHLPLDGASGVTVQLQDPASGRCWGAVFGNQDIRRNTAGSAGALGRLVAKTS